jgi:hypothetical protein
MQEVNNDLNNFQRNVYQKEIIIRNTETLANKQEFHQTLGSQTGVPAEYTRTTRTLQESEKEREEQRMLENLKSNIRTWSVKSAEEMRKLIGSAEEQKKQVQDFLKVRNSRGKNVAEAKLQNEAMGLELQISRRNIQELESQ